MDLMVILNLCMLGFVLMSVVYKYMLLLLMIMEVLVLFVSLLVYFMMNMMMLEIYMIYYMIFSVCESVMGLMIIVLIIRFYGSEMYLSVNLSKFL